MLLWVLLAVVTGATVIAVLVPLGRADAPGRSASDSDLAVYRDQMREIEADLERGVISVHEAEAARTEVARRLLAVKSESEAAGDPCSVAGRPVALGVILGIPLVSLALYLALGSPQLPGQPLSARMSAPVEDQDVATLIARIERHVGENPQDGRGWEVLAPVYMRLGRHEDSARAWRHAIRLLGSTPERQAGLGEALVVMEHGLVTDDARAAFETALEGAPDAVTPRFFLAVAAEQDGDWKEAAERWRALLADAPDDAPWRPAAQEKLAAAEQAGGSEAAGPTQADIAAAADMAPEDRAAMVAGMVERLAARLEQDGQDLDGWLRLARAYSVLGDEDKARAALAAARKAFPEDAAAEQEIDAAGRELGLES